MERDFASTFGSNTSNTSYHPCYPSSAFPTEFDINYAPEPNNNPIFNDPIPNLNLQQPVLPFLSDPSVFNFFGQAQDFLSLPFDEPQLLQVPPPHLHSVYSSTPPSALPPQLPEILPDSTQFLDFFSKPLPALHSLEQPLHRHPPLPNSSDASSSSSTRKMKRNCLDLNLPDNNPQTLDSIVESFTSPPPPSRVRQSELARNRRRMITDKMRRLQKLMPWDKKMDKVTMLEEVYKYVRFLQAQVSVLQSMPISSSFASTELNAPLGLDFGWLGMLNRQQLLQVLVNSPAVQTILCSQGSCVFAYEQLVSLMKANERKTALQQFFIGN